MTDAQLLAWLKDSTAIRCVLMEVNVLSGGVEQTRYLSTKGYVTSPTDTPANTNYHPYIVGGIQFTETLSLDGSSATLSYGDIQIDNASGDRDAWLDDVWDNRAIKVYIGDVRWARTDFRLIFDGIVASFNTKARDKLNFVVADKLQRLNTPVSEVTLLSTTANDGKFIPICLGECHNVEPLLTDPSVNEYQVHNGPIESIIEVRDNGVPVAFTPYLSTGKFRLVNQPAGQITCSVQGDKPGGVYANDIASLVQRLATGYGNALTQFTLAELDTAAFAAFTTANPQPVGIYMSDRANVIDIMNQLATSVNARVLISRAGLLTIIKLAIPTAGSGTQVTPTDIVFQSLYVSQFPAVQAGQCIGYCKNWTVQASGLAAGIPVDNANMFGQEWLMITQSDSLTAQQRKTYVEPTMIETMLLTNADAMTEANTRLNLWNVQRKVYKYVGNSWLMLESLGGAQTLFNSRYNLSNGGTGQIVSLATDWSNPHITVELLV